MKRKSIPGAESDDRIAVQILSWLAAEPERLQPFMDATGLTPDNLRASAADPGFLAGVLDHVMGDEARLLACAAAIDLSPERIAATWRRLGPPEPDDP
ncbi:DUF3572 domain-containing protein [Methylobacterium iners]|nr:DUF3572 domain-containing protein [Methylobacterium iners]